MGIRTGSVTSRIGDCTIHSGQALIFIQACIAGSPPVLIMGQIKLDAPKDASVYLDGAFAGSVQKLKSIWLEPGIYELQVAGVNGGEYRKKVYVLSGKTLESTDGVEAMKWRPAFCRCSCGLPRTGAMVCRPVRGRISYPAKAEVKGLTVAAEVMDPEQVRNEFSTSLSRIIKFSKSRLYPAKGSTVDISTIDFAIRVDGRLIRPAAHVRSQPGIRRRRSRGGTRYYAVALSRRFDRALGNGVPTSELASVWATISRARLHGPRPPRHGDRT